MNCELLITSDGSHTLFVPEIDECYHSTHGAIQESRHIFIEAGLNHCSKLELNILEVGFGTGLNAFLSLIETTKKELKIQYITLEKFPVAPEILQLLNYAEIISLENKALFELMHYSQWNELVKLTPDFLIEKKNVDFTEYVHNSNYDLVFFDAFSPEKQPEMWTQEQFQKIYAHCNSGAILTTYCAKGIVRRALQNAGFEVERLPGPPGKREILRGLKI